MSCISVQAGIWKDNQLKLQLWQGRGGEGNCVGAEKQQKTVNVGGGVGEWWYERIITTVRLWLRYFILSLIFLGVASVDLVNYGLALSELFDMRHFFL